MTRRLVFMRHAKSAWDVLGAPDHDRVLNQRGRLAATLMGAWFDEQPWRVDLALVSTSARTRETLARLDIAPAAIEYRPELYLADVETLWAAARTAPASVETTLILAHNPGLETALGALPNGPRTTPTAAVAVLEFDGDWAAASPDLARIVAYETPKALV